MIKSIADISNTRPVVKVVVALIMDSLQLLAVGKSQTVEDILRCSKSYFHYCYAAKCYVSCQMDQIVKLHSTNIWFYKSSVKHYLFFFPLPVLPLFLNKRAKATNVARKIGLPQ